MSIDAGDEETAILIEETPKDGDPRRFRYVPHRIEPHGYHRIHERYDGGEWVFVGKETVYVPAMVDNRPDARGFGGPNGPDAGVSGRDPASVVIADAIREADVCPVCGEPINGWIPLGENSDGEIEYRLLPCGDEVTASDLNADD